MLFCVPHPLPLDIPVSPEPGGGNGGDPDWRVGVSQPYHYHWAFTRSPASANGGGQEAPREKRRLEKRWKENCNTYCEIGSTYALTSRPLREGLLESSVEVAPVMLLKTIHCLAYSPVGVNGERGVRKAQGLASHITRVGAVALNLCRSSDPLQ